ncbi:Hypothetical protein DB32_002336 [Sandaracinus amylolyticus]|uniref:Uncharacterized protein n=1 Tax=Sandaracinus amylolyticus TaxID=927083 RepID=A0A0F6W1L7_9BACT|nr:Hypothetical protein DB32_002336 [Sandaracinus amylolyticus]
MGLVLSVAGCGDGGGATSCEESSECALPEGGGGVCREGTCGACQSDVECAAAHGGGSTCDEGSCTAPICSGDAGCECEPGESGCACRASGAACDTGLACIAGVCEACSAGAEGCACRAGADVCDDGLACRSRVCERCEPGTAGCSCDAGACEGELLCVAGDCRAAATCADLRDAGLCPASQRCEIVAGAPTCLDVCSDGYRRDDATGDCVMCPESGCAPTTCEECTAMHRVCVSGDVVTCGACEPGYRLDASGACVDERLCGDDVCPAGSMPDHRADGTCECVDLMCGAGQAETPSGTCVTCDCPVTVAGHTGSVHPRASATGGCVCETNEGYYIPEGGDASARPCDEDGDGWINTRARDALRSTDPAIRANARCTLQLARRVTLQNVYQQTLRVYPCATGLAVGADETVCTTLGLGGLTPIELVESDRNDSPDRLADDLDLPTYGNTGRRLVASEINGITRACVGERADYDFDGTPDIAQRQPLPSAVVTNDLRLRAFSHFVELHTSQVVPGAAGGDGELVISERSRCEADGEMGFATTSASTWWRDCHRDRDARFGTAAAPPGLDFAQWSCDEATGACGLPIPAVGAASSSPREAPQHGVCELGSAADWGATWRGMGHHSQFRCTLVDSTSTALHAVPLASFVGAPGAETTAYLEMQDCTWTDPAGPPACTATTPTEGRVGWAMVRHSPSVRIGGASAPDVLGCVDESRAAAPVGAGDARLLTDCYGGAAEAFAWSGDGCEDLPASAGSTASWLDLPAGVTAIAYRDAGCTGPSVRLEADTDFCAGTRYDDGTGVNDRIGSVRLLAVGWDRALCPADPPGIEFYSDGDPSHFGRLRCECTSPLVGYFWDDDGDGIGRNAYAGGLTCVPPTAPPPGGDGTRGRWVTTSGDCDDANRGNFPGNTDAYEGNDENCDGVDGYVDRLVYVRPDGVDYVGTTPVTCGLTPSSPCRTLWRAIAIARDLDRDVAITVGTHEPPVNSGGATYPSAALTSVLSLGESVRLLGGYSRDFRARTMDAGATVYVDTRERAGRVVGLEVASGTGNLVQSLTIRSQCATCTTPGTSVYGMRVTGSSGLVLDRVRVVAGPGQAGRHGDVGTTGANGSGGGRGENADDDSPNDRGRAGSAGWGCGHGGGRREDQSWTHSCGSGDDDSSGSGGFTGCSGQSAGSSPHGSGGNGGAGQSGNRDPGGAGSAGNPGSNGVNGTSGSAVTIRDGWWVGASGTAGGHGGHGGGGGGGGGGDDCCSGIGHGAGGGGGGGGGCAGGPGGAGSAGGASIALFVMSSSVELRSASLVSQNGGNGGNGGPGGRGGSGGDGGGGGSSSISTFGYGAAGGRGGDGGDAGWGGNGGGGRGGDSWTIYRADGSSSSVTRTGTTMLTRGNGGTGGAGGAASGAGAPAAGPAGANGDSGEQN